MAASLIKGKQDKELLDFDSYAMAEVAAKFISASVLTRDKIYINVAARQGNMYKVFYFLSSKQTKESEEGYWLAGDFFNS